MIRLWRRLRTISVFAILLGALATHSTAWAQANGWSYIFTPQLWTSRISQNGFAATNTLTGLSTAPNDFKADPNPDDPLDPQWGFQFAAQKGRWTLALAFQYVDFDTRNDVTFRPPDGQSKFGGGVEIKPGQKAATEIVETTRADLDLAASYFFPDVVKDRLDLSLGGGVKLIYATASREFINLHPASAVVVGNRATAQEAPAGLYTVCKLENCADVRTKDHVNTDSFLAAVTIPMAATYHLANKWLATLSLSPLVGIDYRDDHDVVYRATFKNVDPDLRLAGRVDRQDGTTRAFGGTSDLTFRYLLTDTVSVYAGARVQYINGLSEFLAYGPMAGLSVRFGGR